MGEWVMKRLALCGGMVVAGLAMVQGLEANQEIGTPTPDRPVELGVVQWNRDWSEALERSTDTGKPLLVLFQEIPGCETCQNFGNGPLSLPLMVEAIEDLFVPVLVYNNRPEDEEILKSFGEPAWNNPVVRFLDDKRQDLIERQDGVWQTPDLAARMALALKAAGRQVPTYLQLVAYDQTLANDTSGRVGKATFAMRCYWEGEAKLGAIPGVLVTRAVWVDDLEAVDVVFDSEKVAYRQLLESAQRLSCTSAVFARDEEQWAVANELVRGRARRVPPSFAPAPAEESDQKYYLRNSAYGNLPLSPLQSTRINALLADGLDHPSEIRALLSPRQLNELAGATAPTR
jgi:hypothetical protein